MGKRDFQLFNQPRSLGSTCNQNKLPRPESLLPSMIPDYLTSQYTNKAESFGAAQIFYFLITNKYFYKKSQPLRSIIRILQGLEEYDEDHFWGLVERYEEFREIDELDDDLISPAGKDLLKSCLRFYDEDRCSCYDACRHVYFESINSGFEERMGKLPPIEFKNNIDPKLDNKQRVTNKQIIREILKLKKDLDEGNCFKE